MTQQTPTPQLPTPLAVPWTPPAAPAPAPAAMPVAPQGFVQGQTPVMQPQMQFQTEAPQPFQPQAPQFQPAQAQPSAYQGQHQPYAQNPVQAAPQHTQVPQAQIYQQQPPQAQFREAQMVAPGHPPMPDVQTQVMEQFVEAPASKSLFKSLLKRKPKAVSPDGDAPNASGSLFNKNFVFGLAAGLLLGFVVIPMLLGGSSEPAYTPVAEIAPTADIQIAAQEDGGETFLDTVLASEEP